MIPLILNRYLGSTLLTDIGAYCSILKIKFVQSICISYQSIQYIVMDGFNDEKSVGMETINLLNHLPWAAQDQMLRGAPIASQFPSNTTCYYYKLPRNTTICFPKELYVGLPALNQSLSGQLKAKLLHTLYWLIKKDFYNGEHLAITSARLDVIDTGTGVLSLEAKKVYYDFLLASNLGSIFPTIMPSEPFYQIGVISPLITQDGFVLLMKRRQYDFWSFPGGYVQPINGKLGSDQHDLIVETAIKEIREEVAGIYDVSRKRDVGLSFQYSVPKVYGVSVRQTHLHTFSEFSSCLRTVEFFAPSFVSCTKSQLKTIIAEKRAEDAKEFTGDVIEISLRDTRVDIATQGNLDAGQIYMPALYAAVDFYYEQQEKRGEVCSEGFFGS